MTSFALKGLLTRKLRTALTAIAIVLGVAMVSGTFVLTDSIDKAFDSIFTRRLPEHRRRRSPASPPSTRAATTGRPSAAVRRVAARRRCEALPDVAGRDRRRRERDAQLDRQERQGDRLRRRAEPRLQRRPDAAAVQHADPRGGRLARARRGRRSTSPPRAKKDLAVGDTIGVQVEGPVEQFRISGLVKFGSVDSIGGATLAGFDLADRAAALRQGGQARPDPGRRQAGRLAAQLVAQIQTILPPDTQVRTGDAQAKRGREGHGRVHLVPPLLPARVRPHRALRRRVRDRQLALDHDRAADARARHAADARRVAAPGALARSSLESLVMGMLASIVGLFLGLALAKGLFSLFDAVGFTLPNNGLLLRDTDDRRLARCSGSS